MKRINTEAWKEYKLKDIGFSVFHGSRQKQAEREAGNIPLLTAGKENQGVAAYIGNPLCQYQDPVTVDMFGNCFFHKGIYSGDDNIYFFINKDLNDVIKIFISSIINKQKSILYNFKSQFRQQQADALTVILPSKSDNTPDYEYIESYMKNIMQESEKNIEKLNNIHNGKKTIDILGWREFSLGGDNGLFRIVKGTRLTKANMKDGNINFIGSSSVNNGITNHISNLEHIHPANLITVSYNGSIGEAFYQEKPFWASDDVNVFYPNFKQSFEIAMFLIPLIRKIGQKYKFVDKWKLEDMCNDKITLPINGNGEPDWEYMENYMKNIMDDTKAKLNILKTAI